MFLLNRKGALFHLRFRQLTSYLEAAGIINYWTKDVIARRVRKERKAAMLDSNTIPGDVIHVCINIFQSTFNIILRQILSEDKFTLKYQFIESISSQSYQIRDVIKEC